MKLHRRLPLQAATVVLAGAIVGLPQAASAVDYDKIKQIAEENGITELRMTEAGGASGRFDPGGLPRAVPEEQRHHGDPREPERARQAARHGRGGRGDLGPARALQPRARAGEGARPGRAARLGRDRPAADVRRGQGRVRLRLPVLLDHHGLARGRQGAAELAGFLGRRGLPGQAGAAGLSHLHPADGAARGRRRRSTSSIRSISTGRSRASRRSRTASRCGGRRARSRRSSSRTTRCSTRSPGRAGSPARRASTTPSTTASSTSPSSSCPRAPIPIRRSWPTASSTR